MSQPETQLIERLQAYLRRAAADRYECVPVPPFSLFVDPRDSLPFFNYAIPDGPINGDVAEAVSALRAVFLERDRTPRLEFIEAYAPRLAPSLLRLGFDQESRLPLMVCTPASVAGPEALAVKPGVTTHVLSADSPDRDVVDFVVTQRRGFDLDARVDVPAVEVARVRRSLERGRAAVLARRGGIAAGAASYSTPDDGITEVAGVTTLAEHRRNGVGTAATAAALGEAFSRGVEMAVLSSADDAGGLYQKLGFRTVGTILAMRA